VVEFHQLCNKLNLSQNFQRRVTYLAESDCFITEYLGTFPADVQPHGNSVTNTAEYIHSKPEVLENIAASVKVTEGHPQKGYQDLKADTNNDEDCPCNRKQVMHFMEISIVCTGNMQEHFDVIEIQRTVA